MKIICLILILLCVTSNTLGQPPTDAAAIDLVFADYTQSNVARADLQSQLENPQSQVAIKVFPDLFAYSVYNGGEAGPTVSRLFPSSVKWSVGAQTLTAYRSSAIFCFDVPNLGKRPGGLVSIASVDHAAELETLTNGRESPWLAVMALKDLDNSNRRAVENSVAQSFKQGTEEFYFVQADPTQKEPPSIQTCTSGEEFRKFWSQTVRSGNQFRYLVTDNMALLAPVPENAADQRQQLVKDYLNETESLVGFLGTVSPQQTQYLVQTQRLFASLNRKMLMNDKLKCYEQNLMGKLNQRMLQAEDPYKFNVTEAVDLVYMRSCLVSAASNTNCTVTVKTTGGHDAEIYYAKSGGQFRSAGQLSTVTLELERATYFFQAWRGQKKTGETIAIKCTGSTQPVTITEQ